MHPSIILVLFALSATNALLPRPVSQRVAASQLVAADPPPLQQKRRPRKPGGLLQSRRPLSRKQLKEPAFLWLNKELQWVAQDFLLMVEEESMGFLTVQERLGLGLGLANPNPHPHPHPHPHPNPNPNPNQVSLVWERIWWQPGGQADAPPTDPEVEGAAALRPLVQALGRLGFSPELAVFPVRYVDSDAGLAVFQFQGLTVAVRRIS